MSAVSLARLGDNVGMKTKFVLIAIALLSAIASLCHTCLAAETPDVQAARVLLGDALVDQASKSRSPVNGVLSAANGDRSLLSVWYDLRQQGYCSLLLETIDKSAENGEVEVALARELTDWSKTIQSYLDSFRSFFSLPPELMRYGVMDFLSGRPGRSTKTVEIGRVRITAAALSARKAQLITAFDACAAQEAAMAWPGLPDFKRVARERSRAFLSSAAVSDDSAAKTPPASSETGSAAGQGLRASARGAG